jgi:monoamine oxidase
VNIGRTGVAQPPDHVVGRNRRHGRSAEADVVVVGAGLGGLTAAWELQRAEASVLVIEARDRVGGRVLNHRLASGHVSARSPACFRHRQRLIRALLWRDDHA